MGAVLTSSKVLKELKLCRSTFYYLLKNNLISVPTNEKGRYIWDEALLAELKEKVKSFDAPKEEELPSYKTVNISNRRYLGNKYKLLNFIKETVEKECPGVTTVADIFAGTGSVASAFADKKLIVNDLLYFNHVCHIAWFGAEKYDAEKISDLVCYYNAVSPTEDNYMSENFADTFFSLADCRKIGFIREDIEVNFKNRNINARERAILITSLLYAMDKIANERTLGFKLNPLNWPRMFREYQYRNRLTELLNAPAVRETNFKLRESITEEYSIPMIDDQQLKEIETHQKERETAIQAERENEKQAKINAARSPLGPVVEANDPPAKTEVKQKQTEAPTKTASKDI